MYAIMATFFAFSTANAAESKSSVRISATDWFVSYDQSGANYSDKDEFRIGNDRLSAYSDSDTDIGFSVTAGIGNGTLSASSWAEYADDKDYVVGAGLGMQLSILNIVPRVNWNIDESALDTDVLARIALYDIDAYGRLWWDWEEADAFLGSTIGVGWSIAMTPTFAIRPYWEMPLDSDWETSESVAGVNVNVSF